MHQAAPREQPPVVGKSHGSWLRHWQRKQHCYAINVQHWKITRNVYAPRSKSWYCGSKIGAREAGLVEVRESSGRACLYSKVRLDGHGYSEINPTGFHTHTQTTHTQASDIQSQDSPTLVNHRVWQKETVEK